jgi:beta-N-acetylhexosaminidase
MLRRTSVALITLCLLTFSAAKEKYQHPGPVHLDRDGEKWAEKTLRKMTTDEKVGQLFMIWVRAQFLNVNSPDYIQLRDTVAKYHIGSLAMTVRFEPPFLYRNQPYEAAALLNRLQQDSKLPLLIAADFERGLSMRLYGVTEFPHAMAFGATGKMEYAEAFGRITAQEARAIGVHWNFFPVADVNSNPANPIINTRSFGEDPQLVSDMVSAYIQGAHSGGMLTTVKHFPGHGDTATDSHLGVAKVTGDLARLQSLELVPFEKAIAAGVDSVMVAHVSIPALEPDPNRVATTSPAIVTNLLKNQLAFKGIVVTDALDMAALTHLYASDIGRAAVDTFKAGNEVLIIPADLDASYQAIMKAVSSGEIPQQQLDAAVFKILKTKASLSLHKARLTDLEALSSTVGRPENISTGQQIADNAITLLRDNGKLLPLKPVGTVETGLPYTKVEEVHDRLVVVVLAEDVRTDTGRTLERQIKSRVPDAHVFYIDPRIATAMSNDVLTAIDGAETVIAAAYVVPTAGRRAVQANGVLQNSVALTDANGGLLQKILEKAAAKTIVLAMGNPYLAMDFPQAENYLCAFSNTGISEISVVKALFGEIPIHGHVPVTIPGIATRGSGIDRQVNVVQGGTNASSTTTPH